jgi:hypothetical protein
MTRSDLFRFNTGPVVDLIKEDRVCEKVDIAALVGYNGFAIMQAGSELPAIEFRILAESAGHATAI